MKTKLTKAQVPDRSGGRPAGRPLRLRRPDLIAKAPKSMHTFDLVSQKRVYSLRPACHSWRQSSCCRGRRTRSGYWDLRPPAAAGGRPGSICRLLEACCSTPQPLRHRRPCVPCRRRLSTLLQASPTEKDVAGTLFDSLRRSLTRSLERETRWSGCCTSWAARIARGGCSVPSGRTCWPAPCRPLLERRPHAL